MHLVLIETSGNQNYIFATNKLRENVGASELTYRAGTEFVLDAIECLTKGNGGIPEDLDDPRSYPKVPERAVEVILAVSGKALLLTQEESLARQIVRKVTLTALEGAPGLDIRGVVSPSFDFERDDIHRVIKDLHREYESLRSRMPGSAVRFRRLPIFEECVSSGLPANSYDKRTRDPGPRSVVSLIKQTVAGEGLKRIKKLATQKYHLPGSVDDLDRLDCDWLAVVHADGNGLGQVFLSFDQYVPGNGTSHGQRNREYIDRLRRFSIALNQCTKKAFCDALSVFILSKKRPDTIAVVPLVLGGDDLTVICDGRQALKFTKAFIETFEKETAHNADITAVLSQGVTCCAGVAIIKPHFPFFEAYELAESLLRSAKQLAKKDEHGNQRRRPLSAIDYHILYDASGPDLRRIRKELAVDDGHTLLVGRPYTIGAEGPKNRRWADLTRWIAAVRAKDDDGRRRLPNSMLHELRESVFLGREAADARLKLFWERYCDVGLRELAVSGESSPSLFWESPHEGVRTALLDAIDTAEFWEGNDE